MQDRTLAVEQQRGKNCCITLTYKMGITWRMGTLPTVKQLESVGHKGISAFKDIETRMPFVFGLKSWRYVQIGQEKKENVLVVQVWNKELFTEEPHTQEFFAPTILKSIITESTNSPCKLPLWAAIFPRKSLSGPYTFRVKPLTSEEIDCFSWAKESLSAAKKNGDGYDMELESVENASALEVDICQKSNGAGGGGPRTWEVPQAVRYMPY